MFARLAAIRQPCLCTLLKAPAGLVKIHKEWNKSRLWRWESQVVTALHWRYNSHTPLWWIWWLSWVEMILSVVSEGGVSRLGASRGCFILFPVSWLMPVTWLDLTWRDAGARVQFSPTWLCWPALGFGGAVGSSKQACRCMHDDRKHQPLAYS